MRGDQSKTEVPRPSSSDLRQVATDSVAARDRFDFWRSQFRGLQMRLPDGRPGTPFRAELTQCLGRGGVYFSHIRVDPLVNRYCAAPSDGSFFLTQVLGGRVELRDPGGPPMVATGGLFLTDSSRAVSARHTRYAIAYLRIPRPLVIDAVGGNPLPGREGLLELNHGLAPFLTSQLQLLSERGTRLGAGERAAALDASVDLAFALLRRQVRAGPEGRDVSGQGLFTAAKLYIERHLHRLDLTPGSVARALGCSRARLYRAFAERNLAVFELIREVRLQRSRELLRTAPAREVSAIAFECGYDDPSTFNRAFKRRFGLSPSEWRAEGPPRVAAPPIRTGKPG